MGNYDQLQLLQALGGMGMMPQPQQQQMPGGMNGALMNMRGQQQQNQQPSWLDALNHTMMLGYMMPQQQPMGYGMGMGGGYGMGQQQQQMAPNWWQKGLMGTGTALSGISNPATALGGGLLSMGNPYGGLVAGGGIAAGGLGSLLNYLGQPGMQA